MELRATLTTKLREGTVGEEFYARNQVQRNTVSPATRARRYTS